ncbi:ROK family protein [Metabacillus dongyingensis]|uniref:ROK family protein n=1 Tax=Metabacillus dongyingensis TaxID=2874282 RepID=UPI003B8D1E32
MSTENEYYIGIDIGGTKIAAGIVGNNGTILKKILHPTPESGRDEVLYTLKEIIVELNSYSVKEQLQPIIGIGIGTAGQVDIQSGVVLSGTTNIKDWNNVPLREELSKICDIPVYIDNDVNALAIAEKILGEAQPADHFVCLALGTGVGGAVYSNGNLLRGSWGGAAELGHISIDLNGAPCNCGFRGCLEQYASGTGIAKRMQERIAAITDPLHPLFSWKNSPEQITSYQVFQLYDQGESTAKEVIDLMIQSLSYGIVSIIHAFNPSMVILGGGIIKNHQWICETVCEKIKKMGISSLVNPVKIRQAAFVEDAGLIGAAYQSKFNRKHTSLKLI